MVEWLEHNELNGTIRTPSTCRTTCRPNSARIKANDGQTLHYSMIKPANFNPAKRYPVFLFVYGGPHSQRVTRGWGTCSSSTWRSRASSCSRWTTAAPRAASAPSPTSSTANLGKHEVEDQLTGIDWLAKQKLRRSKRVGVFGWSYGGYMTLRLLEAVPTRSRWACRWRR
jgi:dipeptidyl-peptidase-4